MGEDIFNAFLNALHKLPKEVILILIFELMRNGKITFAEITEMHVKHLEELRKAQSKKMMELVSKIVDIHCDTKKNRDSNFGELMHYLLDEGRVNMTHEDIDKKYKIVRKNKE